MSKVSIIIPCYNHGRFLADAIDSVLCQEYRDVEIIVVDDGSTDATREVAGSFGAAVRYVWQENQGLSAARNHGLRLAQGELIGFLDADDLHHGPYLATLASILERRLELGAVYCGFRFVDESRRLLPQVENRVVSESQFLNTLLRGNFLAAQCMLVRRACYDAIGTFDETLRAAEDWDMWLRIARHFEVAGISDVLAWVRILPTSMSSDPQRMEENMLKVVRKSQDAVMSETNSSSSLYRQAYADVYFKSALAYLQRGDLDSAYSKLVLALGMYPEFLEDIGFSYELSCGGQPKGYRGNFSMIDVKQSAEVVEQLLDRLFADKSMAEVIGSRRRSAYAQAHLALGLLAYGGRRASTARHHLVRAVCFLPSPSIVRRASGPLAKSFVFAHLDS